MPSALKALIFAFIAGLAGILASVMPWSLPLEENLGLNALFTLRGVQNPPDDVVVVAIDRESARKLNLPMEPRKWPRSLHARLIQHLRTAGAAVIAFDMIFNDPQSPEEDQALAQAIERAQNVVLAQSIAMEKVTVTDSRGASSTRVNIEKIVPPIASLAEKAAGQAPFPLPRLPIRLSQYWVFKSSAGDIATLPVVAFHVFARRDLQIFVDLIGKLNPEHMATLRGINPASVEPNQVMHSIQVLHSIFASDPQLAEQLQRELNGLDASATTTAHRHILRALLKLYAGGNSRYLNFYGPAGTLTTIPYYQMMATSRGPRSAGAPFDLKGKAVFVGQTESYWPRAKDGFYTVYTLDDGEDISGVEIAASAFGNLLENKSVLPLDRLHHLGLVFGWGMAAALVSYLLPAGVAAAGLVLMALFYGWIACLQFQSTGTWYPLLVPLGILLPATYFAALVWKYRMVSRERRNIRDAFGYYLPDKVVDQLSHNIKALNLEKQVVYGICLFTDAEHYTNISEAMDPESLTRLMNQYYAAIFKPIKDNGGLILQVIGDSVLALWTAPGPDLRLKTKACYAALGIAEAVQRFNQEATHNQLPTRIGMHAGYMLLGNIGAMDHFEYRPVGDIVNTASRLEGLNKFLGTRILISSEVLSQLNEFAARDMGKFIFIGKSQPVMVYELISRGEEDNSPRDELRQRFKEGLEAFQQQHWDGATQAFNQVIQDNGPDGPSQFYLKLCREYRQKPPDTQWDGSVRLSGK